MDLNTFEQSSTSLLFIQQHRQAYQSTNRYTVVPGNGIYELPNLDAQNEARAPLSPLPPGLQIEPGIWRMEQQLPPQPSHGTTPLVMYNRSPAAFASSSAPLSANSSNRNTPTDHNGTPPAKRAKSGKTHMSDRKEPPRTSQACDHCKRRKIKCDTEYPTCGPCQQSTTRCEITDKNTGITRTRGHAEALDQENSRLQARVRELELLCSQCDHCKSADIFNRGLENRHQSLPDPPTSNDYGSDQVQANAISDHQWQSNLSSAFPLEPRAGRYLGVVAERADLSSPTSGTKLSILGMHLDVGDFNSPDTDEPRSPGPSYNKSYQSFRQTALNQHPRLSKPDLPDYSKMLELVESYFKVVNAFLPALHRHSFLQLLHQYYNVKGYEPSPAETVMIHMVVAIMWFQQSTRDKSPFHGEQSNLHYHYSLGYLYELSSRHTVKDLQALTLICIHLRNFPKPGPGWMLTQYAFTMAQEMGLHRSMKDTTNYDPLEIEIRKRVFWCLLGIHVTLSGRLGMPMPLRWEDFDLEMLNELDDDVAFGSALASGKSENCAHKVGIHAFKIVVLYIHLYSTIYAVRPNRKTYVDTVRTLENKLLAWKQDLPEEFKSRPKGAGHFPLLYYTYVQSWALEFHLLLRHPSISQTNDVNFNSENLRICLDVSKKLLTLATVKQRLKSLDTTWHNTAVYATAITTMLYTLSVNQNPPASEIDSVEKDINAWLGIMSDLGSLLGVGNHLRNAVANVSGRALNHIRGRTQSLPITSQDHPPTPNAHAVNIPGSSYNGFSQHMYTQASVPNLPYTPHDPQSHLSNHQVRQHDPNGVALNNQIYPTPAHQSIPELDIQSFTVWHHGDLETAGALTQLGNGATNTNGGQFGPRSGFIPSYQHDPMYPGNINDQFVPDMSGVDPNTPWSQRVQGSQSNNGLPPGL